MINRLNEFTIIALTLGVLCVYAPGCQTIAPDGNPNAKAPRDQTDTADTTDTASAASQSPTDQADTASPPRRNGARSGDRPDGGQQDRNPNPNRTNAQPATDTVDGPNTPGNNPTRDSQDASSTQAPKKPKLSAEEKKVSKPLRELIAKHFFDAPAFDPTMTLTRNLDGLSLSINLYLISYIKDQYKGKLNPLIHTAEEIEPLMIKIANDADRPMGQCHSAYLLLERASPGAIDAIAALTRHRNGKYRYVGAYLLNLAQRRGRVSDQQASKWSMPLVNALRSEREKDVRDQILELIGRMKVTQARRDLTRRLQLNQCERPLIEALTKVTDRSSVIPIIAAAQRCKHRRPHYAALGQLGGEVALNYLLREFPTEGTLRPMLRIGGPRVIKAIKDFKKGAIRDKPRRSNETIVAIDLAAELIASREPKQIILELLGHKNIDPRRFAAEQFLDAYDWTELEDKLIDLYEKDPRASIFDQLQNYNSPRWTQVLVARAKTMPAKDRIRTLPLLEPINQRLGTRFQTFGKLQEHLKTWKPPIPEETEAQKPEIKTPGTEKPEVPKPKSQ